MDLISGQYSHVCRLPDSLTYCSFRDNTTLAVVPYISLSNRPRTAELRLIDALNPDTNNCVFSVDLKSPDDHWRAAVLFGLFEMRDSLVVYCDMTDSVSRQPDPSQIRSIVRRMTPIDSMPVVVSIPMALGPVFSVDGRCVLAFRLDASLQSRKLIRYDLVRKAEREFDLGSQFQQGARCRDCESPVYYLALSNPLDLVSSNIWRHDPATGSDSPITFYSTSEEVSRFYLTRDSIVYEVATLTPEYKVRWESIAIND